ncbi:MAG: radical SAM family heme chaperone HemW [Flavobacteriales bacterium]|nr:radical SAM family heme chaperone HemW [Flavobacteriales bacterium]
MAGVYIHIPFCRRACHYCDFHFTTNLKNTEPLVESILKEIELQKDYLNGESISTIYFGGGTPSLVPSYDIERILTKIRRFHSVEKESEITLEANPEDLSIEKLTELKSIGINRLSLGTQSFIDSELKWMNRMHTAKQATEAIQNAQKLGFDNISIDLIFGLPDQTKEDWQFNLDAALNFNVQHISSYGLTIENKTVLGNRVKKGLEKQPDDALATEFFKMNMYVLPENGFEHYEISNFAKEGFISRHNSSYWRGIPYLGLGPSAHSFNGISRQWNVRSNAAYVSNISVGKSFFELEKLTETDRLNEQIMIGLRTKWGVQKSKMEDIKPGSWNQLNSTLIPEENQLFIIDDTSIRLSASGKLVADRLASDLFFE